MSNDSSGIEGVVTWELRGPDGELKKTGQSYNIITDVGDTVYATNGAGGATITAAAKPTGMKLGAGSAVATKNGAGAALGSYLLNSHQAFDSGFPSGVLTAGAGYTVTYKVTYPAGKATTASGITEAVIVNETLADATSAAGATVARVLLTGIGSKGASDTLAITWSHKILGS